MKSRELLKKMTIEEKIKATSGNTMWTMLGQDRLDIDDIIVADGPHGVRAYKEKPSRQIWGDNELAPSTLFPSAAAMASTFNKDLLFEVGQTIGNECNHYQVDVLLAPGVNLKRSPLAGRNFEYYSEDPYLSSKMAIEFIKGVQSTKVGACVKHFALNEQEDQRRYLDTICDERTLHELYLRPFEDVIKEANPYMLMSSYNRVNGHYASESSYLLQDVLRNKWHYDGCVISDWGGVQNKVKSILNGTNIAMPGPSEFEDDIRNALKDHSLREEDIDASLYPLFDLRDKVLKNDNKGKTADFELGHKKAYEVSKEAIVLLENDGILPLEKGVKIAVVGSNAKKARINGGGSATLLPYHLESPLEELEKVFDVDYVKAYIEEESTISMKEDIARVASDNDIIVFFTGTTENGESEGRERRDMFLPQGHIDVYNEIKKYNKKVIVVLNNGGSLDLSPLDEVNALIEAWFLGSSNGKALTEMLSGDLNPSGRLSETIPYCIEHTPHFGHYPSKEDSVNYASDIIEMGYRYYDTHTYPVRYPFGYGLSYTTFEYSDLVLNKKDLRNGEKLEVKVTVTNTGSRAGKEVVQLYIHDQESFYPRPYKELKQFKKIHLEANESKTVFFTLDQKDFEIYAVDYQDFLVEDGVFDILVGRNVLDIKLKDEVYYHEDRPIRKNITLTHTLKVFSIYKKEAFDEIVDKYRDFLWHEIEQPAIRILRRIKEEFKIDDTTFEQILESLVQ